MSRKIWSWIKTEKIKLLIVLLVSVANILALLPTYFNEKYVNTAFLLLGVGLLIALLINDCKKTQKISKIYLIGINIISLINFFGAYNIILPMYLLLIRGVLFSIVLVLGLVVVWRAKTKIAGKFTPYLIVSLFTVILNFGGLYESLYSMYFPYGQEGLKIDQGMTYSQAAMPIDFIYYSADAFFGTDISDVSIKYIDYMKWYDKENSEAINIDKYEGARITIQIIKILSLFESMLFIIYISIVVMSAERIKKEEDL